MRKQVYKVGDRVQIVTTATDGHFGSLKGSVGKIIEIDLQHEYPYRVRLNKNSEGENLRLWSTVSPLKPKKSIKKKETKVQELERRIKALEAHRCNPVPQVPNVPAIFFQRYYCDKCGGSYINNQGFHYC